MDTPVYRAWVGVDIAAKTFTATSTPQGPLRPHIFDQSGISYKALITQRRWPQTPRPSCAITPATRLP